MFLYIVYTAFLMMMMIYRIDCGHISVKKELILGRYDDSKRGVFSCGLLMTTLNLFVSTRILQATNFKVFKRDYEARL